MHREERTAALIVTAGSRRCAIPLASVIETMRPLPTEPVAGTPPFVRGLSVIRGTPTLVVDLRGLLDGTASSGTAGRYVTLKAGARAVALAVETVVGIRTLTSAETAELPSLLGAAGRETIEAIGTHDAELLVVLRAARLGQADLWPDAAPQAAR